MYLKRKERLSIVVGILLITFGLALWLTKAFRENMLYFMTPTELYHLPKTHRIKKGQIFRLGGLVVVKSVHYRDHALFFDLEDSDHCCKISVRFNGTPPELFKEGKGVIAEGFLSQERTLFIANRLLAKHDEYYKRPKNSKRFFNP